MFSGYLAYTFYNLKMISSAPRFDKVFLKDGESKEFGVNYTPSVVTSSIKRGAYDGTRYLARFQDGALKFSDVAAANGIHQNEIEIVNAQGVITQEGDKGLIELKTNYKKIYLFSIDEKLVVDSFRPEVVVNFEGECLIENKCLTMVSTGRSGDLRMMLVPEGVKQKKLYKEVHKPEEVAVFKSLQVSDGEKVVDYAASDYVLIGADMLE